jgi:glutamate racemase
MIGFYDSGLGGLTIFEKVQELMPNIAKIYLGDTKNCPLGDKDEGEILEITKRGCDFLFSQGCSLVVIACNTATTIAIRPIQNDWLPTSHPNKKVLGIIRPVSEELIEKNISIDKNIAILATKATINSHFYDEELKQVGFHKLYPIICTGLADAIESQSVAKIEEVVDKIMRDNLVAVSNVDYAILACTHYPIAGDIIQQKLIKYGAKKQIKLLSQANMVAQRLENYIFRHPEIQLQLGDSKFFATSNPSEFKDKIQDIFDIKEGVNLANLD